MDNQQHAGSDDLASLRARLDQDSRYPDGVYLLGDTQLPRQANFAPHKQRNGSTLILILSLIFLQIAALVAALFMLTTTERQPGNYTIEESVNPRPTIVVQSTLPVPTIPPDNTQALPEETPTEAIIMEDTAPTPVPEVAQPPGSAVISLRGMEITQGIQVFNEPENSRCWPDPDHRDHIFCNNSIPLVAGRHTLVRVYPACNGDCPTLETRVQLRLLKEGQEQVVLTRSVPVETMRQINNLPLQELRLSLANSINFEFFPPPAWMSGQITFELEAIPTGGAVDVSPATLSLAKNFAVRKPLRVAYVPVQHQGLRPPEPAGIDYWLLRMYPISDVEYFRLPVPEFVWDGELNTGEVLRKLLYTFWLYAQHNPTESWPDQLFGWFPQESFNGGVSDPFWCPNCAGLHSSRVAFGGLRPEQDIGGPRILVHEIAHNLGAQHAWSPTYQEDNGCFRAEGTDIRVDPEWPYFNTPHIQEFGIDLYSNPPKIYSPSFYDMMAYCARPWISPHTYRKIFDSPFLQPDAVANLPIVDFEPQAATGEGDTLLISGVVYPNGTVSQPEIIRLDATAFTGAGGAFNPPLKFIPPSGDDYCLEMEATDQTILARHCFDAGFLDLETGRSTDSSPFFFTIPNADARDVAKVTISRNEVKLVTVTPSNTPPNVTVTFPNGGETLEGQPTISWQASDVDGDSLRYDVLYSPDDGQSWLPLAVRLSQTRYVFNASQILASNKARIRVIAVDGFHTSFDESDGTFNIKAPLENSISMLGPPTVQPGQRFEVAIIANRVIEPGLFGVQFELNFDPGLVQVEGIRLHPELTLTVAETIQNDAGRVSIVASRQGQVSNLSGDITLATLILTALSGPGDVHLNLSDVRAGARGGIPLTISEIQGVRLDIAD